MESQMETDEALSVCQGDGTKCAECGKLFSHAFYFGNHILTHLGEKQFRPIGQCGVCGLVFSDTVVYQAHMASSQSRMEAMAAEDKGHDDEDGQENEPEQQFEGDDVGEEEKQADFEPSLPTTAGQEELQEPSLSPINHPSPQQLAEEQSLCQTASAVSANEAEAESKPALDPQSTSKEEAQSKSDDVVIVAVKQEPLAKKDPDAADELPRKRIRRAPDKFEIFPEEKKRRAAPKRKSLPPGYDPEVEKYLQSLRDMGFAVAPDTTDMNQGRQPSRGSGPPAKRGRGMPTRGRGMPSRGRGMPTRGRGMPTNAFNPNPMAANARPYNNYGVAQSGRGSMVGMGNARGRGKPFTSGRGMIGMGNATRGSLSSPHNMPYRNTTQNRQPERGAGGISNFYPPPSVRGKNNVKKEYHPSAGVGSHGMMQGRVKQEFYPAASSTNMSYHANHRFPGPSTPAIVKPKIEYNDDDDVQEIYNLISGDLEIMPVSGKGTRAERLKQRHDRLSLDGPGKGVKYAVKSEKQKPKRSPKKTSSPPSKRQRIDAPSDLLGIVGPSPGYARARLVAPSSMTSIQITNVQSLRGDVPMPRGKRGSGSRSRGQRGRSSSSFGSRGSSTNRSHQYQQQQQQQYQGHPGDNRGFVTTVDVGSVHNVEGRMQDLREEARKKVEEMLAAPAEFLMHAAPLPPPISKYSMPSNVSSFDYNRQRVSVHNRTYMAAPVAPRMPVGRSRGRGRRASRGRGSTASRSKYAQRGGRGQLSQGRLVSRPLSTMTPIPIQRVIIDDDSSGNEEEVVSEKKHKGAGDKGKEEHADRGNIEGSTVQKLSDNSGGEENRGTNAEKAQNKDEVAKPEEAGEDDQSSSKNLNQSQDAVNSGSDLDSENHTGSTPKSASESEDKETKEDLGEKLVSEVGEKDDVPKGDSLEEGEGEVDQSDREEDLVKSEKETMEEESDLKNESEVESLSLNGNDNVKTDSNNCTDLMSDSKPSNAKNGDSSSSHMEEERAAGSGDGMCQSTETEIRNQPALDNLAATSAAVANQSETNVHSPTPRSLSNSPSQSIQEQKDLPTAPPLSQKCDETTNHDNKATDSLHPVASSSDLNEYVKSADVATDSSAISTGQANVDGENSNSGVIDYDRNDPSCPKQNVEEDRGASDVKDSVDYTHDDTLPEHQIEESDNCAMDSDLTDPLQPKPNTETGQKTSASTNHSDVVSSFDSQPPDGHMSNRVEASSVKSRENTSGILVSNSSLPLSVSSSSKDQQGSAKVSSASCLPDATLSETAEANDETPMQQDFPPESIAPCDKKDPHDALCGDHETISSKPHNSSCENLHENVASAIISSGDSDVSTIKNGPEKEDKSKGDSGFLSGKPSDLTGTPSSLFEIKKQSSSSQSCGSPPKDTISNSSSKCAPICTNVNEEDSGNVESDNLPKSSSQDIAGTGTDLNKVCVGGENANQHFESENVYDDTDNFSEIEKTCQEIIRDAENQEAERRVENT